MPASGPLHTEPAAEWLLALEALEGRERIAEIVAFGTLAPEQDAGVCEINQRWLRSRRHKAGAQRPKSNDLARFHHDRAHERHTAVAS